MSTQIRGKLSIQSEVVVFPSRNGKRLVGFIDRQQECGDDGDWVILTPKFGESKKNSLQVAYQLAANGLRVLRFDHSNHIGESAGSIVDYSFSDAIADIQGAYDYLEAAFGSPRAQLVANSLSGRCALRVAAIDPRVTRLVLMVGVVNFRQTATEVYQRDMVAEYQQGQLQGVSDILGHQVNVDAFLKDCIEQDMHDLGGSLQDVKRLNCEVFLFCAEQDVWVEMNDIVQLRDASDRVRLYRIPDAMHELRENPDAAQQANGALIYLCSRGVLPEGAAFSVAHPLKRELMGQNKIERERLRAAAPLKGSENDFWQRYLEKYNVLESVGDFRDYLDLLGQCLGPIRAGQVYFDCGCGNGLFGAWCLAAGMAPQSNEAESRLPEPLYFGLDLTAKGLSDATRKHFEIGRSLSEQSRSMNMFYYRYDLDELDPKGGAGLRLPFEDSTIDRICCSLLISYLKHPKVLLSELHRILKPGGVVVVSSMKPFCDLSVIYKDVVNEAGSTETLDDARNLLSAAGAIKLKEEEGHYTFYQRSELESLMKAAGFGRVQSYRSFGDQANVVCAER
ncbi:alpha/beta fold hydrolase [Coraliomargarita akajimensis]|uniref:alpha/beta fold hydrolase n=1 Tax=Coraliomargarita akajimensis TaxID=395922 RepID=UPI00031BACCA|nr:alpha/beta fold hydrolase [Coraliomargarita akajimensis]